MRYIRLFSSETLKRCLLPAFPYGQSPTFSFNLKERDLKRIEENIFRRDHNNNIPKIRELLSQLHGMKHGDTDQDKLQKQLLMELHKLPNDTHERVLKYGRDPLITYLQKDLSQEQSQNEQELIEFSVIGKYFNSLRMEHLSNYTGHKSYYLLGKMAELEQALIQYTLAVLRRNGFHLISVPDILPPDVIQSCGMQTEGNRTQVYKLDSGNCLSGTSEMGLASFFANNILKEEELPLRVAAVSRCFRAETSGLSEEKGIYRVHHFNKVEMFSLCSSAQSEQMLDEFKEIEISIFQSLKLNLRLLDMPAHELGTQAYQKYDIECWMPGRGMWGEISSCSNCTDYQSKRLNIRYQSHHNDGKKVEEYVHTINGTAAAIPRLLIAIVESNQTKDSTINIPEVLREWFNGYEMGREKQVPAIKLVKQLKSPEILV